MNIILTGNTGKLGKAIYNELTDHFYWKVATISRHNNYRENMTDFDYQGSIEHDLDRYRFIELVHDKWGEIDILINNAGIINMKSIAEYTENDYDDIFEVNVKGAFFMSQAALKYMKKGSKIINIGSTRAITGAPNKSLYSMSKFALRSLTQCINAEYNDKGIASTIICPGSFDTVPINSVVDAIMLAINTPNEANIPEIILGGKL